MEGIPALRYLLEQGDFLAKVGLKEAYLTVPIAKEHHHLLGFEWRNPLRKIQRHHTKRSTGNPRFAAHLFDWTG